MEYRQLGQSGLSVSVLTLGTMMVGNRTDAGTAARMVALGGERGVNFIDTADVYADGEAERIVGGCVRRDRDRWVVASKVGNPMAGGPDRRGLGRGWMMQALDDSLKRLGTGYLDIWYLHLDDPDTPLEETLTAVGEAITAGKVRYWGFSNYRGWRVALMAGLAEKLGVPRPVVAQPYYNAMNRMPEAEYLPACAHFGIGVVPYSPLARGVLTGKYGAGDALPRGSRAARRDKRLLETEFRPDSLAMAQEIKAHAEARGMTAGQFAVNWVLNSALVTSAVVGPRTLAQWRENLAALDHPFTAEDEALIDRLVPAGHPSTPGYSDPKYPVTGRRPRTG
jgi:aryl-alcohol dehydrogenase (NADP+)